MIKFNTNVLMNGGFSAYKVDRITGERTLLYSEENNQVQYIGANILAGTLASSTATVFPYFSSIKAGSDNTVYVNPIAKKDTTFTVAVNDTVNASGFQATPSADANSQQIVVCRGLMDSLAAGATSYYHFGLYITCEGVEYMFAYKHVPGGLFWGAGAYLEIVWTMYLGSS
jgi:hypothetical protein